VWVTRFNSASFNDAFSNALINGVLKFAMRSEHVPQAMNTQDFIGVNYYSWTRSLSAPWRSGMSSAVDSIRQARN
jgi:beta-glucosidase/6-phospho-beta-glucosidase/beta-galactosidase